VPSSSRLLAWRGVGVPRGADDRVLAREGRVEGRRVEDVAAHLVHRLRQVRAGRVAHQGANIVTPSNGLSHSEAAEAAGCPDNKEPHAQSYC
jgi:hypothetical protein